MNHIDCVTAWTAPIAFEFGANERVGIRGSSGSGKTTLLRAIAGLLPDAQCHVHLNNISYESLSPEQRNFGYVPQGGVLFPNFSVLDNVTFGLRVRGVSKVERNRMGREWLSKVGLSHHEKSQIDILSGGETKRVALVRALIIKPALLLLDEPYSALDPKLHEDLRVMIRKLHQETQVPILLVSHDASDLADCHRVVELSPRPPARKSPAATPQASESIPKS